VLLLLLLRLGVAIVFVVAAVGKLADRRGTREAVRSFGVPAGAVTIVAWFLPVFELAVAIALLVPASTLIGAIGALALLGAFSAAIALNLARGRRPDCHCFGQVHSEPIGWRTLVRNGVLAAGAAVIAGFAADDAGPSAVAWTVSSPGVALVTGLAAGVGIAVWVAFALMRRHGAALHRVDELEEALRDAGVEIPEPADSNRLPVGAEAPSFPGLAELLAQDKPLFLAFTSPGCGPCRELAPKLARWREDFSDHLTFTQLSYEDDPSLAERYGVAGTPAAIVVGAKGEIESAVAYGPGAVENLFEETLLENAPAPPDLGEPVPDVTLQTLSGERAGLRSSLATDRDTLILFWNPGCGFCDAMRDDLRELDEGTLRGTPALLVVAAGDPDEIRANEFRSPVLLDPMSLASASLGAGGTPTAVRIGADGRLRSGVAGGRDAVLQMAGVPVDADDLELEVVMAGSASNGNQPG
jgi:thiol-disulfide isomerase/thioredoxin